MGRTHASNRSQWSISDPGAKPKNPHAALVYLLLEPLSLGILAKARCELGETAGRFILQLFCVSIVCALNPLF
jgi:hypothetical protein